MSPSTAPEKPGARSSPTGSRFRMRSLRPVSARIISYGREARAHRHTTLYVLRVSRSGADDWYVAKRYSEFRTLHAALLRQFSDKKTAPAATPAHAHAGCGACEELQSFYPGVQFPERHRLQSRLGWSKKRIEASRMEELDGYVRFLLETTQGLLNDDEDDDKDSKATASRCEPLDLIREFLMVKEDQDAHSSSGSGPEADLADVERPTEDAAHRRLGYRQSGRSSSVASLSVRDLDLVPLAADKRASPVGESMRNLFADDWWDPSFADVFDDCAAPPEDAFIHRQIDDAPARPLPNPLRLMDGFPRR